MTTTSTPTALPAGAHLGNVGPFGAAIRCTGRKADGTPCRSLTRDTVTVDSTHHTACARHAAQVATRELDLIARRAAR